MAAGGPDLPRRLFAYNAGFLRQPRLRRILALAGHELHLGLPGVSDGVIVWGRSPHAWRGEAVARRYGVPLVRLEDAFLRSIRPGRAGDPPIGLMIDRTGVHFDSATPSALEGLLACHPLDDPALLDRATLGVARMQALHLSKYNGHDPDLPCPPPGYVLVIDQTAGDASIRHGGANVGTFARMLACAKADHPGLRIVIRAHPESVAGLRRGHFTAADTDARTTLLTAPVSPVTLLAGAAAVLTVSSLMGFEAIMAGHRPRVFGQPFYAGWGLTLDEQPIARRTRHLTAEQMFAAAMILAPVWYDPCRDRLCPIEDALDQMEAEVRAFRQDRSGHVASGMRLWKRPSLQAMFGTHRPLIFADPPERAIERAAATGRNVLIWAGKTPVEFDGGAEGQGISAPLLEPDAHAEGLALTWPGLAVDRPWHAGGTGRARAATQDDGATAEEANTGPGGATSMSGMSSARDPGDARLSQRTMRILPVEAKPPPDASAPLPRVSILSIESVPLAVLPKPDATLTHADPPGPGIGTSPTQPPPRGGRDGLRFAQAGTPDDDVPSIGPGVPNSAIIVSEAEDGHPDRQLPPFELIPMPMDPKPLLPVGPPVPIDEASPHPISVRPPVRARTLSPMQMPLPVEAGPTCVPSPTLPHGFGPDAPPRAGPIVLRVEDGFLRSRGLGARLVPPLSLVADDLGIYYDPRRESRLERLIAGPLPSGGAARAERLVAALIAAALSKYNLACAPLPDVPPGHRILVPGQVEDDASIRAGCGAVRTNFGLLQAVRAANPAAVLVYKPHPDVEAGLRAGAVPARDLAQLADVVAIGADPLTLIAACDEVWTMTSLLGFEALLRGYPVTCLGMPFYAGWGLTRDRMVVPARRTAAPRPDIPHLAHAALIAYPRYFDPVSRRPCPPEVIVERLTSGPLPGHPLPLRWLARAQGRLARLAHLWR